ncbi:MAG TPA: penicillin-binding transpeptidase domain-containing protein [Kofleriaceae bacterium]|nr:penicillin-binding transpeptidase domain-containing protein [Kofleriaceae bacterium]
MSIVFPILLIARGAIVLALALVATRLLRRAPASLRYTVLASALAAVLVLPIIAALVPAWHTGAIAADTVELVEPPALPVAEAAAPAIAHPASVARGPVGSFAVPWRAAIGGLWAAGIAAMLLRVGVGALRARRIARRGMVTQRADPHVAEAWRALDGRGEPPRVVVSGEVDAPIVVGAIAPTVVVPYAALAWSAERWCVVLLHELAHVRRRDGVANLVAQLACSLHWVDPLAWIAARRLREERELAADDAVLRGGARASTYAEHLVAIATGAARGTPAAALAMAGPMRFEARVAALLDGDRSRGPAGARRAIAVAGAVTLVAAVAACVSPDSAPTHAGETTAPGAPPIAANDPALQSAAEQELDRAMTAHHASGAIAIVLDARTGAVLAAATRGDGDARAARAPGSTMKPFTFAAALEAGVVDATTTRVDCEHGTRKYGDKTIADASPHGALDLGGILAVSSNVCTAKLAEPLGDRLAESLRRYHFAAPAHVDTRSIEGASLALGAGIRASALEVAAGYTAFADGGIYHAADGSSERVMPSDTARTVMAMLERVVNDADGTGRAARIDGIRVAGKTGTVQSRGGRYYASFVGIVPADAPRFVVLVGVDGVTGAGGVVAAPVFAKIASRAARR